MPLVTIHTAHAVREPLTQVVATLRLLHTGRLLPVEAQVVQEDLLKVKQEEAAQAVAG